MDGQNPESVIEPLAPKHLEKLRAVVARLQANDEPWGTYGGGEKVPLEDGRTAISAPWVEMSDLCYEAMKWLYDVGRNVLFQWSAWDEGRVIFQDWTEETPASLDHLTTLKLITAIARNDRFFEGAWESMFDEGQGVPLFERLLEHEEALAG